MRYGKLDLFNAFFAGTNCFAGVVAIIEGRNFSATVSLAAGVFCLAAAILPDRRGDVA